MDANNCTEYIIEIGHEFYDYLPHAETSDPDTDARDFIDTFLVAELQALESRLRGHLGEVAQDWNTQAGRSL